MHWPFESTSVHRSSGEVPEALGIFSLRSSHEGDQDTIRIYSMLIQLGFGPKSRHHGIIMTIFRGMHSAERGGMTDTQLVSE